MTRLLLQSLRLTAILSVLTGILYPLAVTGLARLAFHSQATGSLVRDAGGVVGSTLLAQPFAGSRYFWPRPSAGDYGTVPSAASNLGPTSGSLRSNVAARAAAFRTAHGIAADAPVPADMVFASGSGLDPHITPEAAQAQAGRVAAARGRPEDEVRALIARLVEPPQLGVLGEPRVNVLLLNLALDGYAGKQP